MRKGFTLIELLAVIVILAIIALIATPIVLNIIKDTRESTGLRSAEMYLDAVEQSISVEKMNNTKFNPNTCTITDKGNLDCDTKDGILEVKVNGDKPVNGSITFEKGKIKKATLEYKNDKVIVMNTEGKLQYQKYISISNYQHKHTDGTIEDHEVTFDENGHGTCSICMEEVLAAGIYAEDGTMTYSWDELLNDGILIVNNGILTSKAPYPGSNPSAGSLKGKIIIDKTISSIGNYTFNSCTNLTEIIIPELTKIDSFAFYGCTNLTSIEIPKSVTSIGRCAFQGCTNLKSIEIPKGVTVINDATFNGCTSLKLIEIPDLVTSIGSSAFQGCTGLTEIKIPDSVTKIGEYAFSNTPWLANELSKETLVIAGKVVIACNQSVSGEVIIPSDITSISGRAFQDCTGLTSIEIPEGITSLGSETFKGCSNLTSIILPKSLKSLSSGVFSGTSLTTINYRGTEEEWNTNIGSLGSSHFYGSVPTNLKIVYNYNE